MSIVWAIKLTLQAGDAARSRDAVLSGAILSDAPVSMTPSITRGIWLAPLISRLFLDAAPASRARPQSFLPSSVSYR